MTDDEGLVLGVLTTTASNNEISNLEEVLDTINIELPKDIPLKAVKKKPSRTILYVINMTYIIL